MNGGSLSPNQYKQREQQPDFKGKLNIDVATLKTLIAEAENDVVTMRLSGWNRNGQYGEFISLALDSYKPQQEAAPQAAPKAAPPPAGVPEDDDIPF